MNEKELLPWMESLDRRVGNIEQSMETVNREVGELCGKLKSAATNSIVPMLIKWVIFPLVTITGALVGVKLFLPVD